MSVHIIYGIAGTGKTTKCIDIFKSSMGNYNKIFYLVPEPLSYTGEFLITEVFGAASTATVEVTSFKRLYYNTINETGKEGYTKLTESGKTILLNHICLQNRDKLNVFGKTAAYKGFGKIMTGILKEFKRYNITPEILEETVKKEVISEKLRLKLCDLNLIYSKFEEYTNGKFSNADDELMILGKLILDNPELYKNSLFVFDGFVGFTPQELDVILSIMKCCKDIYFTFTSDSLQKNEGQDIFLQQKKSMTKISALATEAETDVKPYIHMENIYKYKSEDLKYLAQSLSINNRQKKHAENISISVFNNHYDEISYVAENILKLVRDKGVRYKDILVILRDSERYHPVISDIFSIFNIPFFISEKVNAAGQPAIFAVICAVEILTKNFSYESIFAYLKSGFANLDYDELDLLENYIIATGIRGSSWTSMKDWIYTPYVSKNFDSEEEFLFVINEIRKKVTDPIIKLQKGLTEFKNVKDKCTVIYDFICDIDLFSKICGMIERFKISQPETAAYYGQVWNILMSTLDEIVSVLGDTEASIREFFEIFITGLSTHEIGIIPTMTDVVTITTAENSEGNSRKYVFAIGVNDGLYPLVMSEEGVLSDSDRRSLKEVGINLASDTVTKVFEEDFVIYSVLTCAAEKLYLTYPISDVSGGSKHPARMIKQVKDLFYDMEINDYIIAPTFYGEDKITLPAPTFDYYIEAIRKEREGEILPPLWKQAGEVFARNSEYKERYEFFKNAISYVPKSEQLCKEILNNIYGDTVTLSVSRLETYKKCPFSYFARYCLRLQTREEAVIQVTDTGSMMHEILEKLSLKILEKGLTWHDTTEIMLKDWVQILAQEKINEIESKFDYRSDKRYWMLARLENMLIESVLFIAKHLKAGKFIPIGYEIEFDDNKKYQPIILDLGDKKIKLRGKIDRADIYQNEQGQKFIRVLDYKSGKNDFDVSLMYYGLQLQLIVYLDKLCETENANPAGILYFRFKDPKISMPYDSTEFEVKKALDKEYKMTGLVLAEDEIVKAMDVNAAEESAVIPVKYKKDGTFSKNSSIATACQFKGMRKELSKMLKKIGREITAGDIKIAPYQYGNKNGCTYCDFKDTCHFEIKCGNRFNTLKSFDNDEIWEIMNKAGENDNA